MKTRFLNYTIAAMATLFIFSCSSDDDVVLDTEKPTILLAKPTDHAHFHLGDVIDVEAIFKDNLELGSFKIDIHSAAGHTHKTANVKWEYKYEEPITAGKREHLLRHSIQIPEEGIIEGDYHFGIVLLDKAGNQTTTYIEIEVGHGDHDHDHDH